MPLSEPNKDFHIQELHLQNFKCFEGFTIQFPKRFTVLVGGNGSGKTAILEGIMSGFLRRIVDFFVDKIKENHPHLIDFPHDYIRKSKHSATKKIILNYPIRVACSVFFGKENFLWEKKKESNIYSEKVNSGISYFEKLYQQTLVEKGNLPILTYYKTSRLWDISPSKNDELYNGSSRLSTYRTSLDAATDEKHLLQWFKRMALVEFQEKVEPPELAAVRKAVLSSLESLAPNGKANIYYSGRADELLVDIGDGLELPLHSLSDGYRNTLGMIADIAYRMAELNPHLTTDSPGIVLIDELDLHLHPKWQKHIVNDLKRIFPNVQFITTTHSPFIIQSLEQGELIKLGKNSSLTGDFTKIGLSPKSPILQVWDVRLCFSKKKL